MACEVQSTGTSHISKYSIFPIHQTCKGDEQVAERIESPESTNIPVLQIQTCSKQAILENPQSQLRSTKVLKTQVTKLESK